MPYPEFDVSIFDSGGSESMHTLNARFPPLTLDSFGDYAPEARLAELGEAFVYARNQGGATVVLLDAAGVSAESNPSLVEMIERGLITHLMMEPAGAFLDWELGTTGKIAEPVPSSDRHEKNPELFEQIYRAVAQGHEQGCGYGESLGKALVATKEKSSGISLLAKGYEQGVPVTVHTPLSLSPEGNFDPLRVGPAADSGLDDEVMDAEHDYLVLANSLENIDMGLFLQFGHSSLPIPIMSALEICRTAASRYHRTIKKFLAALVFPRVSERTDETLRKQTLPSDVNVLHFAEAERRRFLIGDYANIILGIASACRTAGGWN